MTVQEADRNMLDAVAAGHIRSSARLISRIERDEPGMVSILQALYRMGGRSRIVGVTGPPGAGKSTLINGLVRHWRQQGLKVAVLAVDPSSPFSGGAVLGDRLRMADHSGDAGVFIRSMASRGHLGGLSRATGDALTVLDAMPWDIVLIETVGVGQNETDIMRHARVVVLLQTPMGGDDVQAAKAGINEIGDVFVVNKADHKEADRTVQMLEEMIALGQRLHSERTWRPPVVKTQATKGEGVAELAAHIDRCFADHADGSVAARQRDRARMRFRVGEILRDMLDRRMRSDDGQWLDGLLDPVIARESDPYALAEQMLERAGG
jgi:LAO/AO transport system kinase